MSTALAPITDRFFAASQWLSDQVTQTASAVCSHPLSTVQGTVAGAYMGFSSALMWLPNPAMVAGGVSSGQSLWTEGVTPRRRAELAGLGLGVPLGLYAGQCAAWMATAAPTRSSASAPAVWANATGAEGAQPVSAAMVGPGPGGVPSAPDLDVVLQSSVAKDVRAIPPCAFVPHPNQAASASANTADLLGQAGRTVADLGSAAAIVGPTSLFQHYQGCQPGTTCTVPLIFASSTFPNPQQLAIVQATASQLSEDNLRRFAVTPESIDRTTLGGSVVVEVGPLTSTDVAAQYSVSLVPCSYNGATYYWADGCVTLSNASIGSWSPGFLRTAVAHELGHIHALHPFDPASIKPDPNMTTVDTVMSYTRPLYSSLGSADGFLPGHPRGMQDAYVYPDGTQPVDIELLRAFHGDRGAATVSIDPANPGIRAVPISRNVTLLTAGDSLAFVDLDGQQWSTLPQGGTYTRFVPPPQAGPVQAVTLGSDFDAVACARSATQVDLQGTTTQGQRWIVLSADPATGDVQVAATPDQIDRFAVMIESQVNGAQLTKSALPSGGTRFTLPSGKNIDLPNVNPQDADGVVQLSTKDCAGLFLGLQPVSGGLPSLAPEIASVASSSLTSGQLGGLLGAVVGGVGLITCSLVLCGSTICCVYKIRRRYRPNPGPPTGVRQPPPVVFANQPAVFTQYPGGVYAPQVQPPGVPGAHHVLMPLPSYVRAPRGDGPLRAVYQ